MNRPPGSICADYSQEVECETRDLCNHMLAHIQLHLDNYISQLENEKPKRFQKKLNRERISLLKFISENIQTKNYDIIDSELLLRFFRDDEAFKDIISDLYPILKLILRYFSQKTQTD